MSGCVLHISTGEAHKLSGQSVTVFEHPCSKRGFVFPVFLICAHCLFSGPWTWLRSAWFPFLRCFPSGIYKQGEEPPEPFSLQDEQSLLAEVLYIWQMLQSLHHISGPMFSSFLLRLSTPKITLAYCHSQSCCSVLKIPLPFVILLKVSLTKL